MLFSPPHHRGEGYSEDEPQRASPPWPRSARSPSVVEYYTPMSAKMGARLAFYGQSAAKSCHILAAKGIRGSYRRSGTKPRSSTHQGAGLFVGRLVAGERRNCGSLDVGDGAVHPVDDTLELDNRAVASTLNDPAVVHRNGRIDQVASKRSRARIPSLSAAASREYLTTRETRIASSFGVSLTALAPKQPGRESQWLWAWLHSARRECRPWSIHAVF